MSETPNGVQRDQVQELSERFAFHLERWARGRTPFWARHSVDPQDVVRKTLIEVVHTAEIESADCDRLPLAAIRRLLHANVLAQIQTAQHGAFKSYLEPSADKASGRQSCRNLVLEAELLAQYESALNRLSPADRDAVIARAELGLPWSDVIGLLGKPSAAAARMTVSRALVRLAREMANGRND